jgi:RNA polymerase sigma-70 factor (ECF subfamily)
MTLDVCVPEGEARNANATTMALEQLIGKHSSSIAAFVHGMGVARSDIDDVCQRVWLTVSRSLSRIQSGAELAFMRAVARREAGHMRRTYQRRREVVQSEADPVACTGIASDELVARRQLLREADAVLRGLDESLRAVLVLSELNDASTTEMANLLGIPEGTVKSRLRRARAELTRRRA